MATAKLPLFCTAQDRLVTATSTCWGVMTTAALPLLRGVQQFMILLQKLQAKLQANGYQPPMAALLFDGIQLQPSTRPSATSPHHVHTVINIV